MKTLLILRHGKSSWKDSDLADHDRPLNKRGKKDAPRVGQRLRQEALVPDMIITSTAKRARSTTKLVAEECGFDGPVEVTGDFYPGAPTHYLRVLAGLKSNIKRVMVVGHNPGLEHLLAQLVGEEHSLPTAALAQVELPIDEWRELESNPHGRLVAVWRPKEQ